jgi:ABC-2 type transport system permease protein
MRNVWLIARREFLERIHTKSFMISLVGFPLLMVGAIFGPVFLATSGGRQKHIDIISSDPALARPIARELESPADEPELAGMQAAKFAVTVLSPAPGLQQQLTKAVHGGALDGFLWLDRANGKLRARYYSESSSDLALAAELESAVQHAQATEELLSRGLSESQVSSLFNTQVEMRKLGSGKRSGGLGAFTASVLLMMMLYVSILAQGVAVGNSVVEEKTSRIFEIMLATVTPEEMMAGKLLGVGGVGLTQVFVWASCGILLATPGLLGMQSGGEFSFHLTAFQAMAFMVCFVLGFLFYSALSAMMGSLVNSTQELQQLNLFVAMPLVFCIVMYQRVMSSPSSMLSVLLSMLPPFAPILMYVRISVLTPPVWQIVASLVCMLGGVWFMVWLSSRVYRVGVLMYGKRPTLPEIMRWLRYS